MAKQEPKLEAVTVKQICGIIMPISSSDGYSEQHWAEVYEIIQDVVSEIGYSASIVSFGDEAGIIHNRIVTNIAENPIVICDVSSKNPNVMFELGMRLAFDKPTIVIKDDLTNYNFDTSPIEHLGYPASLHFPSIINFKAKLKKKLLATLESAKDENYSTFLKHFVKYKPELKTESLPETQFIIKQLEVLFEKFSQREDTQRANNQIKNKPRPQEWYKLVVSAAGNEMIVLQGLPISYWS